MGRAGPLGTVFLGGKVGARVGIVFRAALVVVWLVVAVLLGIVGAGAFRASPVLPAAMFGAFFVEGRKGLFGRESSETAASLRGGLLSSPPSSSEAALRLRVVIIALAVEDANAGGGE